MDRAVRMIVNKVLRKETDALLEETCRVMNIEAEPEPSKTQIRNLLDITHNRQAASLMEICKYMDYSEAKEKRNGSSPGDKNKAERNKNRTPVQENKESGDENKTEKNKTSVQEIKESLVKKVTEIMEMIKEEAGDKCSEEDKQEIELLAAEKYFGYLYWQVTIKDAEKNNNTEKK